MNMGDLDSRVAIVTGAGMGIGQSCALALAGAGASVLIAEIDEAAGRATEAEIVAKGGRARFVRTDVRRMEDAEAAIAAAVEAWGRLDILVNNAARAIGGVVDAIDEATWNEVITTNLTSVWRFMKCAVPHMREQGRRRHRQHQLGAGAARVPRLGGLCGGQGRDQRADPAGGGGSRRPTASG